MNNVDVLLISNKFDYTTDFVCIELDKRNISYLRLNKDNLSNCNIHFDINSGKLSTIINCKKYIINDNLLSIYYRAPTYFRETYLKQFSTEDQLYNSQWMAFIRNLTFFDNAKWMNNPINTYEAENKLLQLKYAQSVDLKIPHTLVTNNNEFVIENDEYAVKSIDTALFMANKKEAFFYTNIIKSEEFKKYDISLFPLIFQNNLEPKIDYRITIAGEDIFCTKILENNEGVSGDWRKRKNTLQFINSDIPLTIKEKCFSLMKKFNLNFGGIDLVKYKDDFFFIEINPTGEWAWLVDSANQKIYKSIVDFLT